MHINNSCSIRQKYYLKGEKFKINLKYVGHKPQQLGLVVNNRIKKLVSTYVPIGIGTQLFSVH
jgi:hypothetical protein